MLLTVEGHEVFAHTGGVEPDFTRGDAVLLLHGAGNDHSVWRFQTRRLAGMGVPVLAPDLPGHGRSAGEALPSVEAMAAWVGSLLDTLGIRRGALAGHSMGSLIAVQAAADDPDRVRRIALVATSTRMGVHPTLLEAAKAEDHLAIDLIVGWSHTGRSRFSGHPQAGFWFAAGTRRLLERNLHTLAVDLQAVAAHPSGEVARDVTAEAVVIAGERDRMTPAKAGAAMADILACPLHLVPGGSHASLYDHPNEVNEALLPFLARPLADAAEAA